jgi:hypothetical protein
MGAGQVLLMQVPPPEQVAPLAMQVTLPGSQQPPMHPAPVQQRSPGPPQAAHMLSWQARPEAEQVSPGQQIWPAPPHAAQMLSPPQAKPAAVQPCPQQAWPAPPQVTH